MQAGGSGTRLDPLTVSQLLTVYDNPVTTVAIVVLV